MKITTSLVYRLLDEQMIPKDPSLYLHDAMPVKDDCIKIHKSRKATTTVELIQYGIVVDQHCLVCQCHVCKRIDVYNYELHHEQN